MSAGQEECQGPRRAAGYSGTAAPVLDPVVIWREAVPDAPEHRLGPAAGADLAIDRADVGLHRVRAEVGQVRHLGVAHALGDEREDLRLPVGEAFAATRPVQPRRTPRPGRGPADPHPARLPPPARARQPAPGGGGGGWRTTPSRAGTASSASTSSRAGSALDR